MSEKETNITAKYNSGEWSSYQTILSIIKMFKRVSDPAFDMDAPVLKDEFVRDCQYYSYDARQPNQPGRTELKVQDTSRYFLPAEAFIEVKGRILQADGTGVGIGDRPGFVNNGIMALFISPTYMIDGRHIESCMVNVDIATTILGLARYSDNYSRSAGPSMLFAKDIDHPESSNVTMNAVGTEVASMNGNFIQNLQHADRCQMMKKNFRL